MIENTLLYREIHQQPDVLANFLLQEETNIRKIAAQIRKRAITHVVIAARGTSDNAGRYAQYLFGAVNRMPVMLATPSLHSIYNTPPRYQNALLIGISQSGKSPDIVSVLAEGRRQGALTVAITNTPDSDLGNTADHLVNLRAGLEQSVAATKTYTTSLAAIAFLSAVLREDQAMVDVLRQIPDQMRQTLALSEQIAAAAERYRYMRVCAVIGRGFNYATAFELSLKIKELNYVMAEPYSSADFMHGPVAVVERAFPTILIAPTGAVTPELHAFALELKERGAELIVISDNTAMLELARTPFRLPVAVPEWVSPLLSILPGQLLAMHLANARDFDVDKPRGLLKVTETR